MPADNDMLMKRMVACRARSSVEVIGVVLTLNRREFQTLGVRAAERIRALAPGGELAARCRQAQS